MKFLYILQETVVVTHACYISSTLRKLDLHFISHWMGYDRGDSFRFDFEPNGSPFGSKSKGTLSPRSYPIQCERKWKYSYISSTHSVRTRYSDIGVGYCSTMPVHGARRVFILKFSFKISRLRYIYIHIYCV